MHSDILDERALLAAIDETADFIFVTDDTPLESGGPYIVYANFAFAHFLGYEREELAGLTPSAFFGPATDPVALRRLRADMRAMHTAQAELLLYRRDGSTFWADFRGRPYYTGGRMRGWAAVGRDISERREHSLLLATKTAALEAARDPVVVYDVAGSGPPAIEYVNPAFTALFGFTYDEIVGGAPELLHGERTDLPQIRYLRSSLNDGIPGRGTLTLYGKDGNAHTVEMNVNPVREGERVTRWVAILRDVTSQQSYRASLVTEKRRLHATLRCLTTPVLLMNGEEQIEFANNAAEQLFGRSWTGMYGLRFDEAIVLQRLGEDTPRPAESSDAFTFRALHMRGDEMLVLDVTISPVSDEKDRWNQYVVAFDDVTADVATHRRLTYEAMHDPLTGLLNRRGFDVVMNAALTAASPEARNCIVALDLNGFKRLNDRHGHDAGDRYLEAVAGVLRQCVRRGDEIARFGGDEFVMFLSGCDETDAERIAAQVRDAVRNLRVDWHGEQLGATVSFGCAPLPFESNLASALRVADKRLYQMKRVR